MDIIFENRYLRTKEVHKEIHSHYFFKRPLVIVEYILLALVMILCILSLPFPDVFPLRSVAIFWLPISVLAVAAMIIQYVKTVNISQKRDLEINDGKPVEVRMILTNDVIETCLVSPETKYHFSYHSIRKIMTTRNYYVLLTEAKHSIVFKKDGFVKGSPDEFLPFVRTKVNKGVK